MILRTLSLLILLSLSTQSFSSVESDFFRNPEVIAPSINESGTHILVKKLNKRSYEVVLYNIKSKSETPIFSVRQSSSTFISSFSWIGKNSFTISTYHSHRGGKLYLYQRQSDGKFKQLAMLKHTYLFDAQITQQNKLIALRYKFGKPHLFSIDLNDKNYEGQFRSKKRITKGPLKNGQWLTDQDGKTNVNFEKDDGETTVFVKKKSTKKWLKVWQGKDDISFHPVMFNSAKNELLVLSQKDTGYMALYSFDTKNKKFNHVLYQVKGRDITNILINPYESKLIGYSYRQGGVERHVYDKTIAQLVTKDITDSETPDGYVVNFSRDYSYITYINSSIDSPSSYYLYNSKTNKSTIIGEERPWLNKYNLGVSQVVKSTSTDGEEIESYLTLPQESGKKNPPLLVLPHGGPLGVSDSRHFPIDVHYFVQKGYAVLTPNYRGSSGFGENFLNAGKQQWGRLIEDDIESAVDKVILSGNIDKSRICIFGISYGGYSALISAIRRPDLYRCAISYAGVTDIPLLFTGGNKESSKEKKKILTDILGDPDKSWDTLIKYSPVYRAEELTIPVLIAQGGRDRVVDNEHYFRMKYMLEEFNKDYESYYFNSEIHGFRNINNQINFYLKVHQFIKKSTWVYSP